MKKQIKNLENILIELREKLDQREEKFEERSDSWQDSERGQHFQDKTDELDNIIMELDLQLEELQNWINN